MQKFYFFFVHSRVRVSISRFLSSIDNIIETESIVRNIEIDESWQIMCFFFIQEEVFYLLQRSFYGHDIRYFMGYLILGPKLFHCWFLFVGMFVWWILRYLYITTTNKLLNFVIYISYNRGDYSNSKNRFCFNMIIHWRLLELYVTLHVHDTFIVSRHYRRRRLMFHNFAKHKLPFSKRTKFSQASMKNLNVKYLSRNSFLRRW